MKIIHFLSEFTNDSMSTEITSRRGSLTIMTSLLKNLSLAAIPIGLVAMPKRAVAQTSMADPVAALQLALTLEYLEDEFYDLALQSGVITDPAVERVYRQISKHEQAHVDYLFVGLTNAGVIPVSKPTFDFTANGTFDPFNPSNPNAYPQLLALAQAFEDTGVRAYKGQAGNLQGSPFLTAGLQIHSVEARHASEIRRIRGLKGWITSNERGMGMPAATQAVYDGEENVVQGGVDVTTLGSGSPFTMEASTEAYDETITADVAVTIASLFISAS